MEIEGSIHHSLLDSYTYEETRFSAGHYQAMKPVSNGPVLKDLLSKGGRDIAGIMSLPDESNYKEIVDI